MSHTQIITSALITGLLGLCACSKTEPQEPSKIEIPTSDPKKPSTDTPPAEGDKPKDTPPAEDKPKDTPPAEDKPKDTPPAEDKPKDTPPAEDKPKDTPPAEDKPKDTPPSIESKARITEHKYLIVEFMGQDCHNCYQDMVALKAEKARKGDLLALINMHPNSSRSEELYSTDADAYLSAFFERRAVPRTVFNNLQGNRESTDDMIRRPDAIELKANLKLSGRELELELQTKLRAGQEGRVQGRQLKLLVWVIEDDVIAPQIDSNRVWIHNYEYDGLFRGSLNGLWGDDHTLGSILRGKYTLPNKLSRADKSYLLVLVSDANSHEVLDVTSLPLVGH